MEYLGFFTLLVSRIVGKRGKLIAFEPSPTLDGELAKLRIKRVDFLKMDIEGAEIEALAGGQKTFQNTKNFAIACYHKRNNRTTGEILEPVFRRMSFRTKIGFFLHPTLYGTKEN